VIPNIRDYRDRMCKLPVGCFKGPDPDVMMPAADGQQKMSASAVKTHLQIIQGVFTWVIAESHLNRKNILTR